LTYIKQIWVLVVVKNLVKTSSKESPEANADGSTFKESEVEKMQPAEYEAKQDAIIAAMRSGNFIYDLTGSAR